MTGTEVTTSSAWAERALAVLLLPFAFLVMVGGGAGLMWLWQDYRAQFWIGISAVAVLGLLASTGVSVASRQHRRLRWLSRRPAGEQAVRDPRGSRGSAADEGDAHGLLMELLSRVEDLQQDLDVLMGEFTTEQERARSGRHAGHAPERRSAASQQLGSADPGTATLRSDVDPPMMVDIRDDVDSLDLGDDASYDYLFGDDEDFEDDSADDDPEHHQELGLIHTPDPQDEHPDGDEAESVYVESVEVESEEDEPSEGEREPGTAESTVAEPADPDAEASEPAMGNPEPVDAGSSEADAAEGDAAEGDVAGSSEADVAEADDGTPDQSAQAQHRPRRLVRERRSQQQWGAIPAPRDPVQVIDLPREESGAASIQAGLAAGFQSSQPASHGADADDEDDIDYFGADLGSADEYRESHQGSHRQEIRDENRAIVLGEDDDERPRDAR